MNAHPHRRAIIFQGSRRVSAGGWKADLLHLCGSVALMAAVIGIRLWWALHSG